MAKAKLQYILTNLYKEDMIAYMKSHPEHFQETIELALANRQPYSRRAASVLWGIMDENDQRLRCYVKKIIDYLPETNDKQLRELLIVLQKMELSDEEMGILFDICINIWMKTDKQPSLRYNAFRLMIKIIKVHPDLSQEVQFLTAPQYTDSLSDSVKKAISKMIRELH